MLHAEMGRHPIQINIKSRMIRLWLSVGNGKESKLSKLLYTIMLKEQENGYMILNGFAVLMTYTAAGVVPCGGRKTSPRTSTIVQFIFYFGPLRSAIIF